jgi:hypothetical protein
MDGRRKQTDDPRQTRLALGARDAERAGLGCGADVAAAGVF